jgi:predicted metal-dependent hydrolase
LAHLKELNHSARFWAVVAGTFPGHKTARKWLRENGLGLPI